jgi:hypothetical protein
MYAPLLYFVTLISGKYKLLMALVLSYDVDLNPSTQRHYRRLIYYFIYIYILLSDIA